MGGAGGEHLECVGVEDAEDGQHHLLLGQVGEQRAELSRLPPGLLKLRLILPKLEICGELATLIVPKNELLISTNYSHQIPSFHYHHIFPSFERNINATRANYIYYILLFT